MTLYERYTTGDNYDVYVYAGEWAGQTFTVGNTGTNEDHYVTSVKLKVYRDGSPGIVTVGIRTVDSDGKPSGSDLCSVDYNGNMLPTSAGWVEFTFASPAILSPSTLYAIVVRAPSGEFGNLILWRTDATSPTYTGGCLAFSENSGGSWTLHTGYDAMFEEYGIALPPSGLCDWIESKGGPAGLIIPDVFEVINSYLFETPPPGYSFIPTLQNVFGVIDYYIGLNGDAATGCNFFP